MTILRRGLFGLLFAGLLAGSPAAQAGRTITVGADYGLTVMGGASESAYRLALFILSPEGQAILSRHGFYAPTRLDEGSNP